MQFLMFGNYCLLPFIYLFVFINANEIKQDFEATIFLVLTFGIPEIYETLKYVKQITLYCRVL